MSCQTCRFSEWANACLWCLLRDERAGQPCENYEREPGAELIETLARSKKVETPSR